MLRVMCETMPDMFWAKRYLRVNQAICDNLLFAKDADEPLDSLWNGKYTLLGDCPVLGGSFSSRSATVEEYYWSCPAY